MRSTISKRFNNDLMGVQRFLLELRDAKQCKCFEAKFK